MTAIPTMRSPRPSISYDLLPDDVYPARIVRFIGLGIQDQPEFDGKKKDPAFKCSIQFEILGMDATGKNPDGTPIDPRPACVFREYFLFPGASRGGVFDLCSAVDASLKAAPKSLEWFIDNLGAVVMVQVGSYKKKDGTPKNKVLAVQPMPGFMKSSAAPARSDLVGFIPYKDNEANLAAYNKMFKFQRDILMEAYDKENIPFAGKEVVVNSNNDTPKSAANIPTSGSDDNDDDDAPF